MKAGGEVIAWIDEGRDNREYPAQILDLREGGSACAGTKHAAMSNSLLRCACLFHGVCRHRRCSCSRREAEAVAGKQAQAYRAVVALNITEAERRGGCLVVPSVSSWVEVVPVPGSEEVTHSTQ